MRRINGTSLLPHRIRTSILITFLSSKIQSQLRKGVGIIPSASYSFKTFVFLVSGIRRFDGFPRPRCTSRRSPSARPAEGGAGSADLLPPASFPPLLCVSRFSRTWRITCTRRNSLTLMTTLSDHPVLLMRTGSLSMKRTFLLWPNGHYHVGITQSDLWLTEMGTTGNLATFKSS